MTLQVHVGCEFKFEADAAHASVFQVQPHQDFPHVLLRDSWESAPELAFREYLDAFGNRCQRDSP